MLKESPCDQCNARCCKQYGSKTFAVILDPEEHAEFATVAVPASVYSIDLSDRVIPYDRNGNCVLLDGNRCSVHDRKPRLCRKFSCVNLYICRVAHDHQDLFDECPELLKLLEEQGK